MKRIKQQTHRAPRLHFPVSGRGVLTFNPSMAKNYWLVKQEPEAYSWNDFVKDGKTTWTGVRNFQARNNLRAMKAGDLVMFYHSVSEKQIVGIAKVAKEFYPDATAEEGDWSVVDLAPHKPLKTPVTLEQIKADAVLKDMALVRQSRLSVTPLTEVQFKRITGLAGTKA
jgi:predicted RNA-binding protein with PUA-like domain